jgi:hypothetical protein
MVILGEKGLSGIVKFALDLTFIGGIAIFIGLPFILKWYMNTLYARTSENYVFLMVFMYITGLLCLTIVYDIRRIFKTLNRKNPFKMDNVNSLNRIAGASFLISVSYVVKILFYNSFLTVIIAMVFIVTGLFSIILAEVFRQAVIVKEENDLTI